MRLLPEPVPALRGRTPRQAANGREQPLLEALLRQWEYEADLLARRGEAGSRHRLAAPGTRNGRRRLIGALDTETPRFNLLSYPATGRPAIASSRSVSSLKWAYASRTAC